MTKVQIKDATLYHADCWDVMQVLDRVEVVVTDPPYGIDAANNIRKNTQYGKSLCLSGLNYFSSDWDKQKLDKKYIDKILYISENQIIFGGNYYADWLPASSCWIVWDKDNGTNNYADCELVYTSFNTAVRKIKFRWHGMLQEDMKNKEPRFHPTQKPIFVMSLIIDKYTKETDLILDPFMGSGSTGIACAKGGRRFIGIEKDEKYFNIACERIESAYRRPGLFDL